MKIIVLLFLCALVASCASVAPSRGLSGYENVELKPWIYGAQAVSGVTFSYGAPASISNDLGYCVAQHVSNRQVDVKDDSQSYFGAYTGNYYRVERSRSVDGGEVIIPVDKVIRFNMALSNKEGKTEYVFSNIEVAQLDTGIIANSGFQPLGAHKHASPELALNALKVIAEKIQRCI